jgi:hypothetical protein
MSFAKRLAEIWRDYVTDGVPASGAHDIVKSDMRAWGLAVETGVANLNPTYAWDTGTTDADPGEGEIRVNNAALASATKLFVSDTDAAGSDLTTWLATLDDSSNTVKGSIKLVDLADQTNFAIYHVTGSATDDGDYFDIAVTYVTHGGSFADGADIGLAFTRAGDAGSIIGSTGATDNRVLRADGVGGATVQNSPVTIDDSGNVSGAGNIDGSGTIKSSGATAGIGYATGAGGTVTQATSKSTGVTLDKVTGQITTHNAALAAAAEVSFTVTNSAVAATDVVAVCLASGGTASAYLIGVTAVAAGSFVVTIANVSAGSLGEALVINFVVIKGVTS